jgi:uncharacterized protein (UPF0335 family)
MEANMTEQTNAATITEFLDRIASLEEERDVVNADIKSVWAEARAQQYVTERRACKKHNRLPIKSARQTIGSLDCFT